MTRNMLLATLSLSLATPALGHEIDCTKTVGFAVPLAAGTAPALDADGLPSLAGPSAVSLTVDRYPALLAFDVRVHNLADAPSVVSSISDAFPADVSRVLFFGDPLVATIPPGATVRRVYTVPIGSYAECIAQLGAAPTEAAACSDVRDSPFLATTDSNVAECRARVVCAPAQQPPPPPASCVAPSWTGVNRIPVTGVTDGGRLAVGCDGTSYATAFSIDANDPSLPHGALFRAAAGGAITTLLRTSGGVSAIRVDGGGMLDGSGAGPGPDAFVRQRDPTGTLRWEHALSGWAPSSSNGFRDLDVAVDGASNVYVAYSAPVTGRQRDIRVEKLSAAGDALWTRDVGTVGLDGVGGIAVTPGGDVYVAGSTDGTFPGQTNAGSQDVFVAKLDTDGNLLWVRQVGTPSIDVANAAAVDATGRVAVGGTTSGPLDGGAPIGSLDGFVAVWDASGVLQWVRQLRPTPTTTEPPISDVLAVAFDASGALWAGGDVAGGTLGGALPGGLSEAFVARYDAAGTRLWARNLPLGSQAFATDLAIDAAGFGIAIVEVIVSLDLHDTDLVRISPDGTEHGARGGEGSGAGRPALPAPRRGRKRTSPHMPGVNFTLGRVPTPC